MEFTFGYDIENTTKVVQYLKTHYDKSAYEVYYEMGDDEGDGPNAVEILDETILDDEMFIELLANCDGNGEFHEGDEYAEDYDDDYDDGPVQAGPVPDHIKGEWPSDIEKDFF